jgi:hypothetical protein
MATQKKMVMAQSFVTTNPTMSHKPSKKKEEIEKMCTLVSFGMTHKNIEKTWAWNNFEEAKKINQFFDEFINQVKTLNKE